MNEVIKGHLTLPLSVKPLNQDAIEPIRQAVPKACQGLLQLIPVDEA
uniref:Uncharacterized protein n=1 Tax=Anguilla anguilla TaxID=7936 RepID=A0A0E9P5I2_ANGAN